MKKALPLVLIAAALPLAAAADVRVERTYTDDGRIIERRYYDNAVDFGPYAAPVPVIREYPLTAWPGTAAIHTGANNSADQALADRVGQAIASDSRRTVTSTAAMARTTANATRWLSTRSWIASV